MYFPKPIKPRPICINPANKNTVRMAGNAFGFSYIFFDVWALTSGRYIWWFKVDNILTLEYETNCPQIEVEIIQGHFQL